MNAEYIEEQVEPGFVPVWAAGTFDSIWWGILPAYNTQHYRKEIQFRPRFAMALAMMRRKQWQFNNLNLPEGYSSEHGWYSMNVVLGKETDWGSEAPSKSEAMTAYAIVAMIQTLTGWGVPLEISALGRLGAYADLEKTGLENEEKKWDQKGWEVGERIMPFNIETAAIVAVASMLPFSDLRDYYGFTFSSVGGPLVYNGKPKANTPDSPFPFWL